VTQPSEQMLDPNLRDAIRRARGGHVASDALRQSVAGALEEPAAPALRLTQLPAMRWLTRLAIAACLMLAGGVIQYVKHHYFEEPRNYMAANMPLLAAMGRYHEQPAEGVAVGDVSDPAALRDEMSKRLSRRVPTPDLRSGNWALKGASVTPFEGAIAARFDFLRDNRRATLFSLPRFAFAGARDGQTYDITVDGYPITGFIDAAGVHCIVGDKEMPMGELVAMRKKLQQR
jgi:hypothetical protein